MSIRYHAFANAYQGVIEVLMQTLQVSEDMTIGKIMVSVCVMCID